MTIFSRFIYFDNRLLKSFLNMFANSLSVAVFHLKMIAKLAAWRMEVGSGFTFHKIQSILMTSAVNHAFVIEDTRLAVEKSRVISFFLARNLYPHHLEHVVQLVVC